MTTMTINEFKIPGMENGQASGLHGRAPAQGKVALNAGAGRCMIKTGRRCFRERRIECWKQDRGGQLRRCHQQCANGTIVGFVALVVDVGALAVVGCLAHRVLVVQQQIVQAVQRPGSRETQGQEKGPEAPQIGCAGQREVILRGEVSGENETCKRAAP